jgi:hypothetical protein
MVNNKLHVRLNERVEEYKLTPEEVAAIDKARGQLSSHSKYNTLIEIATVIRF